MLNNMLNKLAQINNPYEYAKSQLENMSHGNLDIANALNNPEEAVRKYCSANGIDVDELLKIVQNKIKL